MEQGISSTEKKKQKNNFSPRILYPTKLTFKIDGDSE
jgi:hypothetical protein